MAAYIVIGAGPAGCSAALQLARLGYQTELYEGRGSIPTDPQQGYPLLVTPRGLHAIESVSIQAADRIRADGRLIHGREIYDNGNCLGKQSSGVVYGSSRGDVNLHLYEAALASPLINVHMNHKLIVFDVENKTLEFEHQETKEVVKVDVSNAKVIGADGVHSKVRAALQKVLPSLQVTSSPWINEYRVLFGEVGKMTDKLDPKLHYVMGGIYTSTIENNGQQQWALQTFHRHIPGNENNPSTIVMADTASPENIAALKAWVGSYAPEFLALVPEEEFTAYFSRRTYRGSMVECTHLQYQDFVLLLGDAGHSLLPASGEGINCALEDSEILAQSILANPEAPFSTFEASRMPDLKALHEWAAHLNSAPSWAGEKAARDMFTSMEARSSESLLNHLFGSKASGRAPYREIMTSWSTKKLILLNFARIIAYPKAIITSALLAFQTWLRGGSRGFQTIAA